MPGRIWEVVGGGDAGGIIVREAVDLDSPQVKWNGAPWRLATGACVEELSMEGTRLEYRRLTGAGPDTGFVSTQLGKKTLLSPKGTDITTLLLREDFSRTFEQVYQVDESKLLGEGSYGTVFPAKHTLSGERRAVKKLVKHQSMSRDELNALETEIDVLAKLDHPHIIKLYEYFIAKDSVFIVTEICDQGSFADLKADSQDMKAQEELRLLFRDVMSALAYCHGINVVHRDLKPENLLVIQGSRRREAKVVDFGISAVTEKGSKMNAMKGTPFYRAPEIIRQLRYGPQCDMWSIGIVLFEVLAGKHPFQTEGANMGANELPAVIEVPMEPLKKVNESAKDLICQLIMENPEHRLEAVDACGHSWLRPGAARRSSYDRFLEHHGKSAYRSIYSFRDLETFEQILLTLAAHHATATEVVYIRAQFEDIDSDNNGVLSKEEIRDGLASSGLACDDDDVEELFAALDTSGDGKIAYTEWIAATIPASVLLSGHTILDLFNFFGPDSSGVISEQRLQQVFGQELVESVLEYAGACDTRTLSFKTFRAMMEQVAESWASGASM
eukprot:gb/GFBE01012219.1/.p1 GENE.gb/GFBE01012219.1/~~gb/GFBE01012219.1/.p1  ORF type:complete len:557 (+),score=139.82 gb/GFBE01012219.1/:1-1671(+)